MNTDMKPVFQAFDELFEEINPYERLLLFGFHTVHTLVESKNWYRRYVSNLDMIETIITDFTFPVEIPEYVYKHYGFDGRQFNDLIRHINFTNPHTRERVCLMTCFPNNIHQDHVLYFDAKPYKFKRKLLIHINQLKERVDHINQLKAQAREDERNTLDGAYDYAFHIIDECVTQANSVIDSQLYDKIYHTHGGEHQHIIHYAFSNRHIIKIVFDGEPKDYSIILDVFATDPIIQGKLYDIFRPAREAIHHYKQMALVDKLKRSRTEL